MSSTYNYADRVDVPSGSEYDPTAEDYDMEGDSEYSGSLYEDEMESDRGSIRGDDEMECDGAGDNEEDVIMEEPTESDDDCVNQNALPFTATIIEMEDWKRQEVRGRQYRPRRLDPRTDSLNIGIDVYYLDREWRGEWNRKLREIQTVGDYRKSNVTFAEAVSKYACFVDEIDKKTEAATRIRIAMKALSYIPFNPFTEKLQFWEESNKTIEAEAYVDVDSTFSVTRSFLDLPEEHKKLLSEEPLHIFPSPDFDYSIKVDNSIRVKLEPVDGSGNIWKLSQIPNMQLGVFESFKSRVNIFFPKLIGKQLLNNGKLGTFWVNTVKVELADLFWNRVAYPAIKRLSDKRSLQPIPPNVSVFKGLEGNLSWRTGFNISHRAVPTLFEAMREIIEQDMDLLSPFSKFFIHIYQRGIKDSSVMQLGDATEVAGEEFDDSFRKYSLYKYIKSNQYTDVGVEFSFGDGMTAIFVRSNMEKLFEYCGFRVDWHAFVGLENFGGCNAYPRNESSHVDDVLKVKCYLKHMVIYHKHENASGMRIQKLMPHHFQHYKPPSRRGAKDMILGAFTSLEAALEATKSKAFNIRIEVTGKEGLQLGLLSYMRSCFSDYATSLQKHQLVTIHPTETINTLIMSKLKVIRTIMQELPPFLRRYPHACSFAREFYSWIYQHTIQLHAKPLDHSTANNLRRYTMERETSKVINWQMIPPDSFPLILYVLDRTGGAQPLTATKRHFSKVNGSTSTAKSKSLFNDVNNKKLPSKGVSDTNSYSRNIKRPKTITGRDILKAQQVLPSKVLCGVVLKKKVDDVNVKTVKKHVTNSDVCEERIFAAIKLQGKVDVSFVSGMEENGGLDLQEQAIKCRDLLFKAIIRSIPGETLLTKEGHEQLEKRFDGSMTFESISRISCTRVNLRGNFETKLSNVFVCDKLKIIKCLHQVRPPPLWATSFLAYLLGYLKGYIFFESKGQLEAFREALKSQIRNNTDFIPDASMGYPFWKKGVKREIMVILRK